MLNRDNMCKSTPAAASSSMKTDKLLELISRTASKQLKVKNDLRLVVLLSNTRSLLDRELRWKQQSRKRKWNALSSDLNLPKKPKCDNHSPMEEDPEVMALLGLDDFFNSLKSVNCSKR